MGPGKYDYICTEVRERTNARAALVVVIGGDLGDGFSIQAHSDVMINLPELLEIMAKKVREDIQ